MKTRTIKPKIEKKLNAPTHKLKLALVNRGHFMYSVSYKDMQITTFKLSYTSTEYGKRLIGMISRELGISSSQLKGIEKCTFWAKDFIANSRLLS